jgi:hypothetical protein
VTLQTLFAALFLGAALLSGSLALRHFVITDKPTLTATVVAVSSTGSFFWLWPVMEGRVAAPLVFQVGMALALMLASVAVFLPMFKVATRKA